MAEDILYADINFTSEPHSSSPSQQLAAPQHSRWNRITLWAACTGNVILMVAVVVLALQLETGKGKNVLDIGGCNASLDKFQASLRHRLCNRSQSSYSVNSTCRVCPTYWQRHRNKCYWTSENIKTWNESQYDCLAMDSQLLVIQDKEEMDFTRSITKNISSYWIGLSRQLGLEEKKWMWVTGSQLDQSLFPKLKAVEGNNCAKLKLTVHSEACSTELRWICQKDPLLL